MARRPRPHNDPERNLADLQGLLNDFAKELGNPELRDKVKALIPSFTRLRELGVSLMPESISMSARERILSYLKAYPLTVIDGDELMVVSGIGEWARRVRELRVQFGWQINSGATFKDMARDFAEENDAADLATLQKTIGRDPMTLRPDQYVLLSTEEDRDAAHRWNTLNLIRKSKASVRDKLLRYMRANVGRPVLGEELRYLAGDRNEWPRRMRELRTEDGWPIATKMSGRPDLQIGTYVLELDEQAPEHDRHIPDSVRVEVLTRDGFKCQVCHWDRTMAQPSDPRRFLELHHVVQHKDKGMNTKDNLITLCNTHHDEVHKDENAAEKVAKLLSEIGEQSTV